MNLDPNYQLFQGPFDMLSLSDGVEVPSNNLIYNISVLREKIEQLESLAGVITCENHLRHEPVAVTVSKAQLVANEIINMASSAADALQQINLVSSSSQSNCTAGSNSFTINVHSNNDMVSNLFTIDMQCTGNPSYNPSFNPRYNGANEAMAVTNTIQTQSVASQPIADIASTSNNANNNIIELDAEALVSKCTFYCPICGKGFKRDANLRMHMRAHGDEYKTNEALTKPTEPCHDSANEPGLGLQYSCPVEGCRRNKQHPKFAPLKSVVCVKNHYKRIHCPKLYVCNICQNKEFSILADLKTHEKNCGLRWRCSCGTFFSRKDKLMGHMALFAGHYPV